MAKMKQCGLKPLKGLFLTLYNAICCIFTLPPEEVRESRVGAGTAVTVCPGKRTLAPILDSALLFFRSACVSPVFLCDALFFDFLLHFAEIFS